MNVVVGRRTTAALILGSALSFSPSLPLFLSFFVVDTRSESVSLLAIIITVAPPYTCSCVAEQVPCYVCILRGVGNTVVINNSSFVGTTLSGAVSHNLHKMRKKYISPSDRAIILQEWSGVAYRSRPVVVNF